MTNVMVNIVDQSISPKDTYSIQNESDQNADLLETNNKNIKQIFLFCFRQ